MFTGLIEEIGTLKSVNRRGEALVLTIQAKRILEGIQLGDSIAVNGVCLTAVRFDASTVAMDVMPETYRATGLGRLKPGALVNLERAMRADARFGGHIVQGHVDGTGSIRARSPEDNAVYFTIEPRNPDLFRYIIPKGSIAVDGISLTVVDAAPAHFRISVIPHTLAETVLQYRQAGDEVNLECDIMGKYVEHLLSWTRPNTAAGRSGRRGVTEHFLQDHGFV